ncbi:hypothetical protein GGS23DRAFT_499096 [Durotheca rogersii]|uniref:uncharacterized protein n=1 Tax=Durotheca rogersii TaxID=419775 RepID=UPI00221FFCF5|nr:uncharacterized protein GGS23DRAFT_499096 [Durotheca rogersii]KAI5864427.1 hypothetical protein GGS23DRAFT_499096 [Durotheca rogersii]
MDLVSFQTDRETRHLTSDQGLAGNKMAELNCNTVIRASVSKPREYGSLLKQTYPRSNKGDQQSNIPSIVLRGWVNLMSSDDIKPKPEEERNADARRHSLLRPRTPPASWAKWPSHTRPERTGKAGEEGEIISKDFVSRAPLRGSDMGRRRGIGLPETYAPLKPPSVSAQIIKAVEDGSDGVISGKYGPLGLSMSVSSRPHRGREKSDWDFEYLGLEIPTIWSEYEELRTRTQQASTVKHGHLLTGDPTSRRSSENTIQHGGPGGTQEDENEIAITDPLA